MVRTKHESIVTSPNDLKAAGGEVVCVKDNEGNSTKEKGLDRPSEGMILSKENDYDE